MSAHDIGVSFFILFMSWAVTRWLTMCIRDGIVAAHKEINKLEK
jgi:hypothetical protein